MSTSKTSPTAPQPPLPFLSGGAEEFRLGWKAAALVTVFGASLLLPNLDGSVRSLTYHEVLFAQPAKEMLATGHWILPRFAGIPSTHKPPGAHWAIAVVMWLTGSEAEQHVRIPSALAGVVTALLVAAMAARWFGRRAGLVSGLALLTSYYTLQLGRLAESDMLLIAAVTGAMASFACAKVDSPRGRLEAPWTSWLFYGCATLAFFFKGLIGPAFIFSGCAAYMLLSQGLRGMRFFLDPLGLTVFLAGMIGWYAAAYVEYPPLLHDQVMHHFGRFQGNMGGGKDPFYYAYSIPLITLPWAPLIVSGVVQGLRRGLHTQPFWRFAACWVIPGMVLLSLSTFKSKHYAAPLMPPLTIIGALSLLAVVQRLQRQSDRVHAVLAGLGAIGAIVVVQRLLTLSDAEKEVISGLILVAASGLFLTMFFLNRRHLNAGLTAVFTAAWLAIFVTLGWLMPHYDSYREQTKLASRLNHTVPVGQPLFLVGMPASGENQITYYLAPSLRRIDNPAEFSPALANEETDMYVLAPVMARAELQQHGTLQELDTHIARRKQPENERLILFRLHRTSTVSRGQTLR